MTTASQHLAHTSSLIGQAIIVKVLCLKYSLISMKKAQQNDYPPALRLIQIINYIAVASSILIASSYLFASKDFLLAINGGVAPINRYAVVCGYLAIAIAAGFLLYKFRTRSKYAPEFYVLVTVLGFAIYEIIYYFSDYTVPLYEYITIYCIETVIMAYLLFNNNAKAYFNKRHRASTQ